MNYKSLLFFSFYIAVIIVLFFFFLYKVIKKYNNKYKNMYSILMNLPYRKIFQLAVAILNLLTILYFVIDITSISTIGIYSIIVINIYACLFSFNFHIILANIIYSSISILLLWILNIINNYMYYIVKNPFTISLKILLIILVVVYSVFVFIRKEELLLKR